MASAPHRVRLPIGTPDVRHAYRARVRRWMVVLLALLATGTIGAKLVSVSPVVVDVPLIAAYASIAWAARQRRGAAGGRVDTVVIGNDPMAAIAAELIRAPRSGLVVGPWRGRSTAVGVVSIASWSEAVEHIGLTRCDRAVIAHPLPATPPPSELVDVRGRRVSGVAASEVIERRLERIPLDLVADDSWIGTVGTGPALGRSHTVVKRALDIGAALGGGLILLPLLPVVLLVVRLDSPGPLFYAQTRVGVRGKTFRILKFRSMRQDAERAGAAWTQERDPRVTRVGRFMRLTRIDELPQLWNVLRGEMTLVGPRPERPEFTTLLERDLPAYAIRHAVKPGLTGWAQVRSPYAHNMDETKKTLEYDLYYVKYASLALDLNILFRTIAVVVKMRGC